jgi:acetolactate synthase-1/2/3 large subunit
MTEVKVSDYIVARLPQLTGSKHCFLLSGGGIMHLCDSLGRASGITPVPMHHEQAAAIAADAYGRFANTTGIVVTTTGPGATNAITGVSGAYLDSTPLIAISGQVSRATWKGSEDVRQLGFQEIDIVPIVKSFTKYAVTVTEPTDIRFHLEKAAWLARSGRPGPVWLDVPLDVQAAVVKPAELRSFQPPDSQSGADRQRIAQAVDRVLELLKSSKRPLLVAGHGIWLSGAVDDFRLLVAKLGIPVQTSWNGADLLEESHPLYFGRHNSYGPRYPNIIVQNCDLLISLGCRLGIQQIGYNWTSFAQNATKVMVDVDAAELHKRTLHIDLPIQANASDFIGEVLCRDFVCSASDEWLDWCNKVRDNFPVITKDYLVDENVDPHVFVDVLSDVCPDDAVVVPGSSGTGFTVANQQFKIKRGQRFFSSKGHAAMGYGIPSSIGACLASGRRLTITIVGDGGLMLNVQELQTISHHSLPIKVFVFSNAGYFSIRTTQRNYFQGRFVGSDASSGVSIPDLRGLAAAFGLPYNRIERHVDLAVRLDEVLSAPGPSLTEVMLSPDKPLLPKLSSRRKDDGTMESLPLDDMEPFLDRAELADLRNACKAMTRTCSFTNGSRSMDY